MKSQKGITMLSLILYVASFLTVTGIVALITTFFYNNVKIINSDIGSSAYYNKLNLYVLKEVKSAGNEILKYNNDADSSYITFKNGNGVKNTFISANGIVYYNKIALCKNVSEFNVSVNEVSGNKVVKILITIDGTTYSTSYTMGA